MSENLSEYQLYIRGSELDPNRPGFNIYDQQWHTTLKALHNRRLLNLTVYVVSVSDMSHVNPILTNYDAKRLPLLSYNGEIMLNTEIEDHLISNFPEFMGEPHEGLNNAILEISHAACVFLNTNSNTGNVANKLKRLEGILQHCNSPYLGGSEICFADICLFVRLHFMQIVLKYSTEFSIPSELRQTKQLLDNHHANDLIVSCCPADQDIIKQYMTSNQSLIPYQDWKFLSQATYTFGH